MSGTFLLVSAAAAGCRFDLYGRNAASPRHWHLSMALVRSSIWAMLLAVLVHCSALGSFV